MASPIGQTNKCPKCFKNLLCVDKIISTENVDTDDLYIYKIVQGHCKVCGAKLRWKSSYLHLDNKEIIIENKG